MGAIGEALPSGAADFTFDGSRHLLRIFAAVAEMGGEEEVHITELPVVDNANVYARVRYRF